MTRRANGFSLLELVVVLAIFALVALVGVQVIRSTVLTEQRLASTGAANAELAVTLALLRRDMRAAIGVGFFTPTGIDEPALQIRQNGFSLSVGGLSGIENSAPDLGRITWRRDPATGQLRRQVWTTLVPGGPGAGGAEVTMLGDVAGLAVEAFTPAAGWQPGFTADPRAASSLPHALRVRLQHAVFGQIETLVSLR